MLKWFKELILFLVLYVVKLPKQYKEYKGMMRLQLALNRDGYCELFLQEFEQMTTEQQSLHILIFLDIARENPAIKEEESFKIIIRYAEQLGVIRNGKL